MPESPVQQNSLPVMRSYHLIQRMQLPVQLLLPTLLQALRSLRCVGSQQYHLQLPLIQRHLLK